jgi:hypothetical protein
MILPDPAMKLSGGFQYRLVMQVQISDSVQAHIDSIFFCVQALRKPFVRNGFRQQL